MEKATSIKKSEDEETTEKKEKVDLFVFLPDDILSDILRRLPDDFLGYRAKYVCRRWMDIISNRIVLDCASFILQNTEKLTARHVGIREEKEQGLQVKVQDLDMPCMMGKIRSSGIEFLLIESDDKRNKRPLFVYNLMTKQGSYLPECKASCRGVCRTKCGVAISFDVFKGIYKVVHLFSGPPIECHILTLRKNIVSSKWKKIKVPKRMNGGWLCYHNPVSVQGRYIHWRVADRKRMISMDMVKGEIVDRSLSSLPLTRNGSGEKVSYTIFEMGGSLALYAGVSEDKAEIWILKDIQRNKWEKLHSVTFEKWYDRRFPICGVMSKSNRYTILESKFYDEGIMWYYDLKTGALKKLDIHIGYGDCCMVHSSPPPTF